MRIHGQNLEGGALAQPGTPRRRGAEPRAAISGAFEDRPAVVSIGDFAAGHGRADWLRRLDGFSQIELSFDDQDRVLWCYMRPPGRPSVTLELAHESRALQRAIQQIFREQPTQGSGPIRYMVWSSRRPGIFNLGGDLRLFAQLIRARDREGLLQYATACIDVVYTNAVNLELPLITVSLVRGDALGGGFEAAISSNLVIAERGAKFGLPEMLFNLFPGMGAYSLMARRIGAARAERMILGARLYSAEELHELGLVDVLANDGKGEEAVYEYVEQFGRRHSAHCAVYRTRQRVGALSYQELLDVARIWVDAALMLEEPDLRRMERLAAAQDRRIAALASGAAAD